MGSNLPGMAIAHDTPDDEAGCGDGRGDPEGEGAVADRDIPVSAHGGHQRGDEFARRISVTD
jgi:hypothetical protein